MLSGLFIGLAFEVTQNQRNAVLVGQAPDFLEDDGSDVADLCHRPRFGQRRFHQCDLTSLPSQGGGFHSRGQAARYAVKPVGQGFRAPDGVRLAGQHQERGLEAVFRVLLLTQDLAADAQDHGPVPMHQLRERLLIAPGREALEELSVRRGAFARRHSGSSSATVRSQYRCPRDDAFFHLFFGLDK
jgi:hypothetical protein